VRVHSVEVPNTLSDCVRPVRSFHISAVVATLVIHALLSLSVAFRAFFACRWVHDRDARDPLQDASSKHRPVACACLAIGFEREIVSGSIGAPWRLRYCGELWRMDLLVTPLSLYILQRTPYYPSINIPLPS
jgi:hypothetical protein